MPGYYLDKDTRLLPGQKRQDIMTWVLNPGIKNDLYSIQMEQVEKLCMIKQADLSIKAKYQEMTYTSFKRSR